MIGAGPAGLLFSIFSQVRRDAAGLPWTPILLVDKRTEYVRTHRLRMDPKPFEELAKELEHPAVARILEFLEEHRFSPTINLLEALLSELALSLGVERATAEFGGQALGDLGELRQWLESRGTLDAGQPLVVVGADSVHSDVRGAVAQTADHVEHTHETLARLLIHGAYPRELSVAEQYRLAKLLGSVLDFRINSNGYAEVDLFLSSEEHGAVGELGAVPASPAALTPEVLAAVDAPFFKQIVDYFIQRADGSVEVSLQSTFRLEHRYVDPPAFVVDEHTTVFLVGDAAVSLPFFRGTASLARCTASLAEVLQGFEPADAAESVSAYSTSVADVREREIEVVAGRGRAIRVAREFAKVSALLPFPMQSWLLSLDRDDGEPRWTADAFVGAALAAAGGSAAVAGGLVWGPVGAALVALAVSLHALGGAAFLLARTWEPRPNALLVGAWRAEIGLMTLGGPALAAIQHSVLSWGQVGYLATMWFVMGVCFALGLVLTRAVRARILGNAAFD